MDKVSFNDDDAQKVFERFIGHCNTSDFDVDGLKKQGIKVKDFLRISALDFLLLGIWQHQEKQERRSLDEIVRAFMNFGVSYFFEKFANEGKEEMLKNLNTIKDAINEASLESCKKFTTATDE